MPLAQTWGREPRPVNARQGLIEGAHKRRSAKPATFYSSKLVHVKFVTLDIQGG